MNYKLETMLNYNSPTIFIHVQPTYTGSLFLILSPLLQISTYYI